MYYVLKLRIRIAIIEKFTQNMRFTLDYKIFRNYPITTQKTTIIIILVCIEKIVSRQHGSGYMYKDTYFILHLSDAMDVWIIF